MALDGPALAGARLGLVLGSGADVTIAAADMILLRDDLSAVPEAIALARATFRTIRRNLARAFGYKRAFANDSVGCWGGRRRGRSG